MKKSIEQGHINLQKPVTADADTVICFRFWGEADMPGRAALLVPVENDPQRTIIWLSLPQIKSVRIDGAALQERASLGCARCVE
jgi:hypothetical protein